MSAPASACCDSAKPSRAVRTRPPTRSLASITVTAAPSAERSRAAARPASPAPATTTVTPVRSLTRQLSFPDDPMYVCVDLPLQNLERHRPGAKHRGVEVLG